MDDELEISVWQMNILFVDAESPSLGSYCASSTYVVLIRTSWRKMMIVWYLFRTEGNDVLLLIFMWLFRYYSVPFLRFSKYLPTNIACSTTVCFCCLMLVASSSLILGSFTLFQPRSQWVPTSFTSLMQVVRLWNYKLFHCSGWKNQCSLRPIRQGEQNAIGRTNGWPCLIFLT